MVPTTMLEKFNIIKDVISSSTIYIIFFILIILLAGYFVSTTRRELDDNKKIYIGLFTILPIFLIIYFREHLYLFSDYFMSNIATLIFFPNLTIYTIALIITAIIMFKSVFSPGVIKIIKMINSTIFTIIYYLFVLILGTIKTNSLSITNQLGLYSNQHVQVLLELSGIIFTLWMIFLIIYHIVNKQVVPVENKYINETYIKMKPQEERHSYDQVLNNIEQIEDFKKLKEILLDYQKLNNKQNIKINELETIIDKNI